MVTVFINNILTNKHT